MTNTRISSAVVAHQARIVEATELTRTIGGLITVDDGSLGAEDNHLRAWALTAAQPADWALVLEDDALPVAGFLEQAEAALTAAPADVVSFYLGRSKPPRWQRRIPDALQQSDLTGAHWITCGHMIHAVAIAMRASLRDDWIDWAHTSTLPIDQRVSEWCRTRGHLVAYSTPSLVEHADLPTLVAHRDGLPRDKARIAWRTGIRERWNSTAVMM